MSLIVCKFGGTSVASPERIQMVAKKLIAKKQAGHDVVAVVSAMGKTTDELVGLAAALNEAASTKTRPPKQLRRRLEEWTPASGLFLQAAPQPLLCPHSVCAPRTSSNAVAVKWSLFLALAAKTRTISPQLLRGMGWIVEILIAVVDVTMKAHGRLTLNRPWAFSLVRSIQVIRLSLNKQAQDQNHD